MKRSEFRTALLNLQRHSDFLTQMNDFGIDVEGKIWQNYAQLYDMVIDYIGAKYKAQNDLAYFIFDCDWGYCKSNTITTSTKAYTLSSIDKFLDYWEEVYNSD